MRQYPLSLSVKRPNWSANTGSSRAPVANLEEASQKIFKRDDHTCQCCGFRAEKYQEILHINGDNRDWRGENVLTVCLFCAQCFDLMKTGQQRAGMLVWMPELSQSALHHVMRALYVARVTTGGLAETARATYERLLKRGEEAKKRLGSSDPEALAIVLRDFLNVKQYADAQERLSGIRLLPLDRRMVTDGDLEYNQFPQILAYWRSKRGPFGELPANEWVSKFSDLAA
jgi:intracellular multiplication protein IcmJ